jgi:uncharacterized membrane protein
MRGEKQPRYNDRQLIIFAICIVVGLAIGIFTSRAVSGMMAGVLVGGAAMVIMSLRNTPDREQP